MKIPTSNATTRLPFASPLDAKNATSNQQAGSVPAHGSAAGAGTTASGPEGWSPSERLARYADHMMARLDAFEAAQRESGLDLSSVRDAFEAHMQGLQDAMRTQGLDGAALATGIQDAVNLVRDGVRDAMGMNPMVGTPDGQNLADQAGEVGGEQTNLDIQHSLDRLGAMEARIGERMNQYLANLAPEEHGRFQEASDRLQHSFGRLRDALATGQMSLEDVRRSLANVMEGLRDDLAPPSIAAMTAGDGGQGPVQAAAPQAAVQGAETTPPTVSQVPASSVSPAWTQFLADLGQERESGLTQLWQSQPRVQALLLGLQQDARAAQNLNLATYSPSAQLQALRPDGFGGQVDFAI